MKKRNCKKNKQIMKENITQYIYKLVKYQFAFETCVLRLKT